MLTLKTTLEPNGQINLPPTLCYQQPVSILVTFLEEPSTDQAEANAAVTLSLLRSPAFRSLPKSDPLEIEQRITALRDEWNDE